MRPAELLLVLAVIIQSAAHIVNVAFFDLAVMRLNADHDDSLVGWLGTITTFLVAWGALQLAVLRPLLRRPLSALAAICAFLSLDDMVAIHEIVARLALRFQPYEHAGYNLWPAVYLPLLVVTGWLLARTARVLDVSARNAILAGLVCLVAAVALEFSAPILYAAGSDHGLWLYEAEVIAEEALETLGWGYIALGVWAGALDFLLSPETAPTGGEGAGLRGAQPLREAAPSLVGVDAQERHALDPRQDGRAQRAVEVNGGPDLEGV